VLGWLVAEAISRRRWERVASLATGDAGKVPALRLAAGLAGRPRGPRGGPWRRWGGEGWAGDVATEALSVGRFDAGGGVEGEACLFATELIGPLTGRVGRSVTSSPW